MRKLGWALIGATALMAVDMQAAQAGVTCKIIPSWCPSDGGQRPSNHSQKSGYTGGNQSGSNNNQGTGNQGNGNPPGFSQPSLAFNNTPPPGNNNPQGNNNQGSDNPPGWNNPPGGGRGPAPTSIPEPATLMLLGAGISAVGAAALRRLFRAD